MTKTGYHFYTERDPTTGEWVGRCKEFPTLTYQRYNRDTALSGIRRTVESMSKKGTLPGVGVTVTVAQPTPPSPVPSVVPTVVAPVPPPQTQAPVKPKFNRVAFVIDRSGSMRYLIESALKALESNINTIREQDALTGQTTFVTVVAFDDQIDVIRRDMPLSQYRPVTLSEVYARNQTALFDATATAIDTLLAQWVDPNYDIAYLVITLTDGEENASRRYNSTTFPQKLQSLQATDRWTFTFLVPPKYGDSTAQRLGVPRGNVAEWEASTKGVQEYTQANAAGLTNYYNTRSVGGTSTRTFYTDTSKMTSQQVKANLVDIRKDVAVWPVNATAEVRAFCEQQGARPYVAGAAFYQLMKPEKVQSYKQLLVVDRNTGAVYAGHAARQLLGVPTTVGTIRLAPGNHSNYDVYIQSTSVNRKLFPGSKVIYYSKVNGGF